MDGPEHGIFTICFMFSVLGRGVTPHVNIHDAQLEILTESRRDNIKAFLLRCDECVRGVEMRSVIGFVSTLTAEYRNHRSERGGI